MAEIGWFEYEGMTPIAGSASVPASATTLPNVRIGQMRPTYAQSQNVPTIVVSKPGSFMVMRDFGPPVFGGERGLGTLSTATVPVPYTPASSAGVTGATGAWVAGTNKGAGIDTADGNVTRYYILGWETGPVAQAVDPSVQMTGRPMQYLFDYTSVVSSTITSSATPRINTLTIPDLSASVPVVPGVLSTEWRLTVWVRLENQAGEEWSLANPAFYVGEIARTGGTIVDSYSVDDLNARGGWYPLNFVNMRSGVGAGTVANKFLRFGSQVGQAGFDFSTQATTVNSTSAKVRTNGSDKNQFILVRDSSATNRPYDAKKMKIVNIQDGGGGTVSVTVEAFHCLSAGQTIYFYGVNGTTALNGDQTVLSVTNIYTFKVTAVFAAWEGGGTVVPRPMQWPSWVLGHQLAVQGSEGLALFIQRIVASGGSDLIVETDAEVPTAITTNSNFRVMGDFNLDIGHADPRFFTLRPRGLQTRIELPGLPRAVIGSPTDDSVCYVFTNCAGKQVSNIPVDVSPTGLVGNDALTQPQQSAASMSFGASSPTAVCYGRENTILGYDEHAGFWEFDGSFQRLLDPNQLMSSFYREMTVGAARSLSRIEDVNSGGGTSTTSLAISVASKTFTVSASGLPYPPGYRMRAYSAGNAANYMEGVITSYAGTSLILNVDTVGGSGTHADWVLALTQYTIIEFPAAYPHGLLDGMVVVLSGITVDGGDASAVNGTWTVVYISYNEIAINIQLDGVWDDDTGRAETYPVDMVRPCDFVQVQYDRQNDLAIAKFPGQTLHLIYDFRDGTSVLGRGQELGVWPMAMCIQTLFAPLAWDADANAPMADPFAVIGPNVLTSYDNGMIAESNTNCLNDLRATASDASSQTAIVSGVGDFEIGTSGDFSNYNAFNILVVVGTSTGDSTIGTRLGSWQRITGTNGGNIEVNGFYKWSGGEPEVGDVVSIGGVLNLFETGDIRGSTRIRGRGLRDPQFTTTSTQDWTLFALFVGAGTGWTSSDAFASATLIESDDLLRGQSHYPMARVNGGRSMRVRLAWFSPTDAALTLNKFTVEYSDSDPKEWVIDEFPGPVERGDKAEVMSVADLNAIRGPNKNSLGARPGSRMLTLGNGGAPSDDPDCSPTNQLDAVHLVLRPFASPIITVTTLNAQFGFPNATIAMCEYKPLGSLNTADVPSRTPY